MSLQVNNIWYSASTFRKVFLWQKQGKVTCIYREVPIIPVSQKNNATSLYLFQCTFHDVQVTDMLFCIGPAFR